MVIANAICIESADVEIVKENDAYLKLYKSVSVPFNEMERIVTLLHTRGETELYAFIRSIARSDYDFYLQRRYVFALMNKGEIEFDVFSPIDERTTIWTNSSEVI